MKTFDYECGTADHFSRRTLLKTAGLGGLGWLTPLSQLLAREQEKAPSGKPARSVIILWMAGGPSQLESFDPHPGTKIGGDTKGIKTAVKGLEIAEFLPATAEIMDEVSLVRSVVSKEGDHERATYNMKTGFRPDPTLVHPGIGAVLCHELPVGEVEIPRHISILSNQWPARGGYLGSRYDAFRIGDPAKRIPDVSSRVDDARMEERLEGLSVIDRAFNRGRHPRLDEEVTQHNATVRRALEMMSSDQLVAFDVNLATEAERKAYGDSAFGRGCLAARRLIETGVRCVEVTLGGFDTHFNNYELCGNRVKILDPAFAALIRDLKERKLLDSTIVLCGGEFGRTPKINPAEGRDHWPHGFSVAMAGGGFRRGYVHGATDPEGGKDVKDKVRVQDIHATVLEALGIDFEKELDTPVGRPMAISKGYVVDELLAGSG